ncbi:hypothetical protein E0L20_06010 [Enterobacter wuhouensis]|uniref:Uncharacterized protein n=1 Tax=Enterobacter wuhouensis TaxID=2529381 RepID=A0A4R0GC07_9ENTR|nr:hypothetical protein E0L20_06010 [Enterobacter wuhouensis]
MAWENRYPENMHGRPPLPLGEGGGEGEQATLLRDVALTPTLSHGEREKGYFVTRSYQTISAFSPC